MAKIVFYEKPGCSNNTRQKALLQASGHILDVRDLLATPWTVETLRPFFGDKPVADWFNRAAPKVKEGVVVPERFDEASALAAMLAEPLLIRRPLMECGGQYQVGFDVATVTAWVGLADPDAPVRETCPRTEGHACAAHQ